MENKWTSTKDFLPKDSREYLWQFTNDRANMFVGRLQGELVASDSGMEAYHWRFMRAWMELPPSFEG